MGRAGITVDDIFVYERVRGSVKRGFGGLWAVNKKVDGMGSSQIASRHIRRQAIVSSMVA
jgi:hypothetical protein